MDEPRSDDMAWIEHESGLSAVALVIGAVIALVLAIVALAVLAVVLVS